MNNISFKATYLMLCLYVAIKSDTYTGLSLLCVHIDVHVIVYVGIYKYYM